MIILLLCYSFCTPVYYLYLFLLLVVLVPGTFTESPQLILGSWKVHNWSLHSESPQLLPITITTNQKSTTHAYQPKVHNSCSPTKIPHPNPNLHIRSQPPHLKALPLQPRATDCHSSSFLFLSPPPGYVTIAPARTVLLWPCITPSTMG